MNAIEMRAKRAALITAARELVEKSKAAGLADLSKEHDTNYRKMMEDAAELLTAAERDEELEKKERGLANEPKVPAPRGDPGAKGAGDEKRQEATLAGYSAFMRGNFAQLDADTRRDLQADQDNIGGYIVPPQSQIDEILKNVDDEVMMRRISTVHRSGRNGIGVPTLTARAGAATWGTELQVPDADTSIRLGTRELKPRDLVMEIDISIALLAATPKAGALVNQEIAYAMGITEETAFLTGSGAGRPLGVFTADANGISTGRDMQTDNTTTAIGADNLKRTKYLVKQKYWGTANWIFHRDAMLQIALLKDGMGQYLLRPGLTAEEGEQLLAIPVILSEFAPNTFTTGLYVGIFGSFKKYWINDSLEMRIQRLNELLARSSQVGFIARAAVDGMPVVEEAFARVTLA